MMIVRRIFLLLSIVLTVSSCDLSVKKISMTEVDEEISSKVMGHSYFLYIYLPSDYEASNNTYPVLYLLDGDAVKDDASRVVDELVTSGVIPPVIVVAIGYGSGRNMRMYDYTPTVDSDGDGGGARDFWDFLTTELFPYIDSNYRVTPGGAYRYIAGHSFGGIAVLYGFFFHNDAIKNFIATSPSLWWDNEIFFKYESEFHVSSGNIKLFLSTGALEGMGMNILMEEFAARLLSRGYSFLTLKRMEIPHKRHWNNRYIALKEGLKFTLGSK